MLLELIQTKVNYVVQESIIVIKDIFRCGLLGAPKHVPQGNHTFAVWRVGPTTRTASTSTQHANLQALPQPLRVDHRHAVRQPGEPGRAGGQGQHDLDHWRVRGAHRQRGCAELGLFCRAMSVRWGLPLLSLQADCFVGSLV